MNARKKDASGALPAGPSTSWLRDVLDWLKRSPPHTEVCDVPELRGAVATSVGRIRASNEDRACIAQFVEPLRLHHSFVLGVVCDGIGGMKNGEESACLAIASTLEYLVGSTANEHLPLTANRLVDAVSYANRRVYEMVQGGGGTTMCAVLARIDQPLCIVSVGDSRAYGIGPRSVGQLTKDDTIGQELANIRKVPLEQVDSLEFSDDLSQFIGMGDELQVRPLIVDGIEAENGVFLASDGVWRMLGSALPRLCLNASTPYEMLRRCVQASLWCGGHDNLSAVAIEGLRSLSLKPSGDAPTLDVWLPQGLMRTYPVRNNVGAVAAAPIEKTVPYVPTVRIPDASEGVSHKAQMQEPLPAPTADMFGEPNRPAQPAVERKPRRTPKKKNPIRLQTHHSTDGRRSKKS